MKISTLWFGGDNYSSPEINDIEYYNSIKEAEDIFWDRYINSDNSTPCVNNSEMWIVKGIVKNIEYPDLILRIGKREGIKREKI